MTQPSSTPRTHSSRTGSRRTVVVAGSLAAVAATAVAIAGVAVATADDVDTPITGEALERASAAALAHTGGGRVTGTEVGDEDSYYEVEVTLDDGRQVDVQLDESFVVVDLHDDVDGTDEADGR